MDHQDWTRTTITNPKAAVAARQAGAGPRRTETAIKQAKLAEAEGPVRVKVLSPESVRTIQDYRRENKLTQKELDQRLSMPAGTIGGLESRKHAPSPGHLRDLNRLLKTGLTLE